MDSCSFSCDSFIFYWILSLTDIYLQVALPYHLHLFLLFSIPPFWPAHSSKSVSVFSSVLLDTGSPVQFHFYKWERTPNTDDNCVLEDKKWQTELMSSAFSDTPNTAHLKLKQKHFSSVLHMSGPFRVRVEGVHFVYALSSSHVAIYTNLAWSQWGVNEY